MTQFSVKKPYTVFVAVVAVLIFGIISYLRMVPDLLPNMDYPYIVVVTTYPGAVPEEVESAVTRPLEQSLATINNVKTIQSTSAENYSMLMMEFEAETNMDSAVVDILQSTQLLAANWDEKISAPNIIRINPNMIPVMVAGVSSADMDRYELADFAEKTLIPALEGTTGLASVTTGGLVERTLTVEISEEKLDAMNERLEEAINKKLDEARQELEDAQEELDEAQAAVNAGTAQLVNAPSAMTGGLGKSADRFEELLESAGDTATALATAQTTRATVEQQLEEARAQAEEQHRQAAELDGQVRELNDEMNLYRQAMGPELDALDDATPLRSEEAALPEETIAALEARGCNTLGAVRMRSSMAEAQLAVVTAQRDTAQATADAADAQVAQLEQQLVEMDALIEQLESAQSQQLESMDELRKQLAALPGKLAAGIAQMSLAGGQLAVAQAGIQQAQEQITSALDTLEEQLAAAIDLADMHAIITLDMLTGLLTAQDFDMPAGYVYDDKGNSVVVSVGNGIAGDAELRALPLFDPGVEGIEPILLEDVAELVYADNSGEIYASLNAQDSLILMFSKQSNFATAQCSRNLRDTFARLEEEYPGLSFSPLMDQGDYIYLIRDSILSSLGWSVVFSVLTLLLFLGDWRPTVITLMSIPISLLTTLTLMYFMGVSINIMSLSGLAVSVGMLVDNSVVVIENTYRLRSLGENSMKSAVSGARQVAGAVAASTLTTVCVFIPIAFLSGTTKELFTDMVLTLSFALVASLVVSLTLVPAAAGKLLEKARRRSGKNAFERLMPAYRRSVMWAVGHKAVVLLLVVVLLFGSGALVLARGYTFMPEMEMNQMLVSLTMPEDSSFAETAAMANAAAERMLTVDGVETVGGAITDSATGLDLTAFSMGGDVTFYVLLRERGPKVKEVAKGISEACADLACTVNADSNSIMSFMMSSISGSGITVRLFANDLDVLRRSGDRVAAVLSTVEGVGEVQAGEEEPTPEIHITVDKEEAVRNGLTVAQVYMQVVSAIRGSARTGDFQDDGKTYTLSVELKDKSQINRRMLEELEFPVTQRDNTVKTVRLSDIAELTDTQSLTTISRTDQRRYLDVTAEVLEGYNITKVTDAAEAALAAETLEEGTRLQFTGERENIMSALKDLLLMLIVGVILVYLVMVAQFQNLKAPFIVMFAVPLAFTGGFLGLLAAGMEINVLSMLGMIMLVGIIVNNGIVLVDYINQLRLGGMERTEAIGEAAVTRLRPILMTSITTILGLVVMAMGRDEASSLLQPLAVTCIGGLTYATFMTLYVVPVMYDIFSKKELYQVAEEDLELSTK
ncbi:MAG: efflux RND transporter permease subunit [Oscillospiraceae bacterium]|nr:efflux RND transporter permease subunit [Oscillospiraceae bacterium]